MMNCKQASELASKTLDSKLGLWQRLSLRFHLMMCRLCRTYAHQLEFLHRIAPQIDAHIETHTDIKLAAETKAKLKQSIDQQR